MLNKTYADIITLFQTVEEDNYISNEQIASALSVSNRTAYTYINKLKCESMENGFQIEAVKGKGYKLIVNDEKLFNLWMNDQEDTVDESEVKKRQRNIFTRLITDSNYVNVYELADELNISASSARKDIKAIEKLAHKYDLEIKHSWSHGYLIVGEEHNIRNAISKECTNYLDIIPKEETNRFRTSAMNKLTESIESNLAEFGIVTSYESIDSLVIHILIALNRIETDNPIEVVGKKDKVSAEYLAAQKINKDVEMIFGLSLQDDEVYYFSQHIKNRNINFDLSNSSEITDDEANTFYNLFLRQILKYSNIDFFADDNLRMNLMDHIGQFIFRLKNGKQIQKSNLLKIKDEFPYAMELAVVGLKAIDEKYETRISQEETLYFAIHLALSLESNKNIRKYNIAVVLDERATVFKLISYKIKSVLKERVNIIQLFRYPQINEEMIEGFDIIVNATGNKLWFEKPTISVRDYISGNEINHLTMIIDKLDQQSEVQRFMSKELYFVMECDSKEELISKVTREVSLKLGINQTKLYKSIKAREVYGSTVYSNRIAIPHPLDADSYPSFISICRLRKPIMWDDLPVQLVFLFSLSGSNNVTKDFFDQLSKLIRSNKKISLLNKTTNYEEFIKEFFEK